MLLSEIRQDFELQLTQVNQKIQQLSTELQQLQQQSLKLQGACEAVDLIEQNTESVVVPISPVDAFDTIDVETTPVKRTTKK